MFKNFPKINERHQTTDVGCLEIKQNKYPNSTFRHVIFQFQKTKDKEKSLKDARQWGDHLSREDSVDFLLEPCKEGDDRVKYLKS